MKSYDPVTKLYGIEKALRYYKRIEAEVKSGEKKKCFLTTACVNARGLPDNCEELTVLRKFRDGYMSGLPDGPGLIRQYYETAPGIVDAINSSQERTATLDYIYGVVGSCVEAIKRGNPAQALESYKSMFVDLSGRYGRPAAGS